MDLVDKDGEKYLFTRYNQHKKQFEEVNMITGAVTPLKTSEPSEVERFSLETAAAICDLVRSGKTIAAIAKMDEFPSATTIYNWKSLFPLFAEKLEAAIKDRSFYFQDMIIDDLKEVENLHKDEVPAKKLQVDTAFKLMEKSNPEVFGNKVQLSGNKDAPLTMVIDTGIRRQGDEGFDDDKFKTIDATFAEIQQQDSDNTDEEMEIIAENAREKGTNIVLSEEEQEDTNRDGQ